MAEGILGEQGPTQMPGCAEQLRDTWNSLHYVRNNIKLKHLALVSKIKEDKSRKSYCAEPLSHDLGTNTS